MEQHLLLYALSNAPRTIQQFDAFGYRSLQVPQKGRSQGREVRFLDVAAEPVTAARGSDKEPLAPQPAPSFLADRDALHWYDGEPLRDDSTSVTGKIGQFRPKAIPADAWARIEPVVQKSVEAAKPETGHRATALMNAVTQLASWADTIGQPLEPEILFHPEIIDRFVFEALGHLGRGTRSVYRGHLRVVAKAVIGSTLYPPTGVVPRPNPRSPYTPEEVNAIVSWASARSTEHMRRNAMALVAIGLGAGLTSQEITRLTGDDVFSDGAGVVVRVIGQKPREVPVLRRWEQSVEEIAVESGARPFLLPDRTRILKHAISNFLGRCSRDGAPGLSVLKLRTTWVVQQLTAGTPLPILARWRVWMRPSCPGTSSSCPSPISPRSGGESGTRPRD